MTFYYTVAVNGVEKQVGTEDRGFIRGKYKNLQNAERYFFLPYKDSIERKYAGKGIRDIHLHVYEVLGDKIYDESAYMMRKIYSLSFYGL